jgi:hypothetical protein
MKLNKGLLFFFPFLILWTISSKAQTNSKANWHNLIIGSWHKEPKGKDGIRDLDFSEQAKRVTIETYADTTSMYWGYELNKNMLTLFGPKKVGYRILYLSNDRLIFKTFVNSKTRQTFLRVNRSQ